MLLEFWILVTVGEKTEKVGWGQVEDIAYLVKFDPCFAIREPVKIYEQGSECFKNVLTSFL